MIIQKKEGTAEGGYGRKKDSATNIMLPIDDVTIDFYSSSTVCLIILKWKGKKFREERGKGASRCVRGSAYN